MASAGHDVIGLDFEAKTATSLQAGKPPLFEPGLEELLREQLASGRLRFTSSATDAFGETGSQPETGIVLWVTHDTPITQEDSADVDFVVEQVVRVFPNLNSGDLVLISSQVSVGTTRTLERRFAAMHPGRHVSFAYSPENLRLGSAITSFTRPDRVIVGIRSEADRMRIAKLLETFAPRIEWMSIESAEMTKHSLNAFLATSVSFINEVAVLCEKVGADAKDVERGLKTESRIGPKAYLSPGPAFAGGTLAREISTLVRLGLENGVPTHLLEGVIESNHEHQHWACRRLTEAMGDLRGRIVAIWGLTYKPGTDTLRRSGSLALCKWLCARGTSVRAHDPVVHELPPELAGQMVLLQDPLATLEKADALVVATPWKDYLSVGTDAILSRMDYAVVLDPARLLAQTLGADPRIHYITVGKAGHDGL
jgi:UDPglucose 6-dehydrogenase